MHSPDPDRVQCALIVQRLMDADLLLPEEGNALLEEITAWDLPMDGPDAEATDADRFIQALEAVLQTTRIEASARQPALKAARSLLHQPADATLPLTPSDTPRD